MRFSTARRIFNRTIDEKERGGKRVGAVFNRTWQIFNRTIDEKERGGKPCLPARTSGVRRVGVVFNRTIDVKERYPKHMNIHRYYVPNAIVFITQVVDRRAPVFREPQHVELLRGVLGQVKELHPFAMLGYVFLPDHLHLLIRPTGESNFSDIMHSLKPHFTKQYKALLGISGGMKFWQKRFWDHVIRDEHDFERHLDYIHYNPVRHRLVERPEEWPHSSYHYWREKGAYPAGWGWGEPSTIRNRDWQPSEGG